MKNSKKLSTLVMLLSLSLNHSFAQDQNTFASDFVGPIPEGASRAIADEESAEIFPADFVGPIPEGAVREEKRPLTIEDLGDFFPPEDILKLSNNDISDSELEDELIEEQDDLERQLAQLDEKTSLDIPEAGSLPEATVEADIDSEEGEEDDSLIADTDSEDGEQEEKQTFAHDFVGPIPEGAVREKEEISLEKLYMKFAKAEERQIAFQERMAERMACLEERRFSAVPAPQVNANNQAGIMAALIPFMTNLYQTQVQTLGSFSTMLAAFGSIGNNNQVRSLLPGIVGNAQTAFGLTPAGSLFAPAVPNNPLAQLGQMVGYPLTQGQGLVQIPAGTVLSTQIPQAPALQGLLPQAQTLQGLTPQATLSPQSLIQPGANLLQQSQNVLQAPLLQAPQSSITPQAEEEPAVAPEADEQDEENA